MVPVPLVRFAMEEFKFLFDRAHDDVMQVLAMVQWRTQGTDTKNAARAELSKLARDLGYRRDGDTWSRAA